MEVEDTEDLIAVIEMMQLAVDGSLVLLNHQSQFLSPDKLSN
jgi:hypothetical protein